MQDDQHKDLGQSQTPKKPTKIKEFGHFEGHFEGNFKVTLEAILDGNLAGEIGLSEMR